VFVQVEVPRVQPKLSEPFLGFTQTAEIWNSRACMIGLIGTFIVELVMKEKSLRYLSSQKHVMFGVLRVLDFVSQGWIGFLIFRC
jgi:hypothetical protein